MSFQGKYAGDDDSADEDKNLPQEQDLLGGGEEWEEMLCPSCGASVAEETQKCPSCGDWIIPQHPSSRGWKRWLFIAAVLLMLWAILRMSGLL